MCHNLYLTIYYPRIREEWGGDYIVLVFFYKSTILVYESTSVCSANGKHHNLCATLPSIINLLYKCILALLKQVFITLWTSPIYLLCETVINLCKSSSCSMHALCRTQLSSCQTHGNVHLKYLLSALKYPPKILASHPLRCKNTKEYKTYLLSME